VARTAAGVEALSDAGGRKHRLVVDEVGATEAQEVVDEIREECRELGSAHFHSPVLSVAWALAPLGPDAKA